MRPPPFLCSAYTGASDSQFQSYYGLARVRTFKVSSTSTDTLASIMSRRFDPVTPYAAVRVVVEGRVVVDSVMASAGVMKQRLIIVGSPTIGTSSMAACDVVVTGEGCHFWAWILQKCLIETCLNLITRACE